MFDTFVLTKAYTPVSMDACKKITLADLITPLYKTLDLFFSLIFLFVVQSSKIILFSLNMHGMNSVGNQCVVLVGNVTTKYESVFSMDAIFHFNEQFMDCSMIVVSLCTFILALISLTITYFYIFNGSTYTESFKTLDGFFNNILILFIIQQLLFGYFLVVVKACLEIYIVISIASTTEVLSLGILCWMMRERKNIASSFLWVKVQEEMENDTV